MKPTHRNDRPQSASRGIVRSMVRKGSRNDHSSGVVGKGKPPLDPTLCMRCGAVYHNKTWRHDEARVEFEVSGAPRFAEGTCPACLQVREHEYYGRVLLQGGRFLSNHEGQIRGRIENVASRARFTQPERRIVEIARLPGSLEVRTTSQELAHRIAHELVKCFRGHATYDWSDRNGELLATWTRDDSRN